MRATDFARAFLTLYDEMLAAYERLNRHDFSAQIARSCAEFRAEHPEAAEALIGMQLHFSARNAPAEKAAEE